MCIQVDRIAAQGKLTMDSGVVEILSLHKKVCLAVATLSFQRPWFWPACCTERHTYMHACTRTHIQYASRKCSANCVAPCSSSCNHCIVCWEYFKCSVCANQRMYPTCGNAVRNIQKYCCLLLLSSACSAPCGSATVSAKLHITLECPALQPSKQ